MIAIGGSYPGAVSAWMRYKFPHIVDWALSSSGVINAIEDFYMYDHQVYDSLAESGSHCTDTLEQIATYWDDL